MDPADSDSLSRVESYSGARREIMLFSSTGLSPSLGRHSRPIRLTDDLVTPMCLVLQPSPDESGEFGLDPLSLAATDGVAVAFLSSG